MTIQRIQGPIRANANSGSSLSVTLTNTPAQNSLIILAVGTLDLAQRGNTVSAVSQSGGGVTWTKAINHVNGNYYNTEIWYGYVTSASATATINVTLTGPVDTQIILDAAEYSGVAPIVDEYNHADVNGTTIGNTGTSDHTDEPNELYIGAIYGANGGGYADGQSQYQSNGFTLLDGQNVYGSYPWEGSMSFLEKIAPNSTNPTSSTTTFAANPSSGSGCIATFKAIDLEALEYCPHITTGTPGVGEDTVYNFLFSDNYNDPSVGAKIRVIDLGSGGSYANIYGAVFTGNPVAPAIACSHHLIVRKDFLVRGQVESYEGILTLHGGYAGWAPTTNPMIWLVEGGYYGSKNTLELRKVDSINPTVWGWGDLACGQLTINSVANTTVRGPLYLTSGGTVGYNSSSIRFKENVEDLQDCSWLYDLRPVTFDWKEEQRKQLEGTQMGLIAEEVSELSPQLVFVDKKGKPEGVHYEWLGIPLLVEIKKLRKRVEALENQIKEDKSAA